MARARLLATLLALAATLAGCTSDETPPADGGAPPVSPPGQGSSPPPSGGQPPQAHEPTPPVTDGGQIMGPFEESWTVVVAHVGARGLVVDFNLTGLQAGAPPTARVQLSLLSPDGSVLKEETIGLGASTDAVHWRLGPSDVAVPGEYALRAVAADAASGGLPSGGLAQYALYAAVEE